MKPDAPPLDPDLARRVRENASSLRWLVLPILAVAATFWIAVLSVIAFLIWLALSGPETSVLGLVGSLALLAAFLWPLWTILRPLAAPESYVRSAFAADVVNDDPAYADLVAEVAGICETAGAKVPRCICVAQAGVNACVFGLFPSRMAMVFGQDLLDAFSDSPERLRAVIAHEVGHMTSGDTRISSMYVVIQDTFRLGVVRPCAVVAGFFGFTFLAIGGSGGGSRLAAPGDAAGVVGGLAARLTLKLMGLLFLAGAALIWIAGWLASAIVDAFQCAHSRRREFMADRAGAILTSRDAMIDALRSLDKPGRETGTSPSGAHPALQIMNLSGKGTSKLFRTHPSTEERIERLRSWTDLD